MENNNTLNYMVNLQKVKSKIPKHPRGNKSMPSKVITKNKKPSKLQNEKNVIDSLTIQPLIKYPKNDNFIGKNKLLGLNDAKSKNNNLLLNNHNDSSTLNNFRSTASSLPTTNSFLEYDLMDERLSFLHDLFSSLSSLTGGPNPFYNINQTQKTVELSPEIFRNTYKNFVPSITSTPEEFSEGDIIKGYAQNSSQGNIRDYNEDTITTTKITLDNGEQFYFFGVYDGHGGKGCSLYLQKNLHSHIKQFSKDGIKKAIDEVEEQFEKTEALDEKGEIKDQSGSCGIMTIIQKNKCIIANVGDSRLVVFKNNSLFFCTEDHKPDSPVEKERINKAGGSIYQTPSLFPLYQNGKKIDIPWRVLPGRLSVSRTFGDIEAKSEKFGGNKNVVATLPDITEIDLNEEFNLIVLGCDGIFDVLSNEEILECIKYVLKEKNLKEINDEVNMSELCGDFAAMIIKSALAKDSFDNVSCVVIAINIKDLINN
jgi:protein phosphatase 2C family protein 2/3